MKLYIGNKNYSSWSLRPWLALKMAGVAFEEERICLDQPDTREKILAVSPTGRVPALVDGTLTVYDSLAICEYVNEAHAGGKMWPANREARARARAAACEMHSSFTAVRTHMSMNIRRRAPERGAAALARPEVAADVARLQALWAEALLRSGGPCLFGEFCIADAFYAPVLTRFVTYGVALEGRLAEYSSHVLGLAPMREWTAAAHAETEDLGDH
jgi:glutathione S-transferase